jgi:hypothetical protein
VYATSLTNLPTEWWLTTGAPYAPGKQGRYVRIQLLDENYLSLAEVQVMGIDL